MEIKRKVYLNRLINKKNNGMIKVITGIRDVENHIYLTYVPNHLIQEGIPADHIIKIELDRASI